VGNVWMLVRVEAAPKRKSMKRWEASEFTTPPGSGRGPEAPDSHNYTTAFTLRHPGVKKCATVVALTRSWGQKSATVVTLTRSWGQKSGTV